MTAPTDGFIEIIIEKSGTPCFCFKHLDENKPAGSIKIRIETIDFFFTRYREDIVKRRMKAQEIEAELAELERRLLAQANATLRSEDEELAAQAAVI